ncbi:DUF4855 domain-containing protein [Ammoniphilus sp. CFH 90114]|uniref:DUF4855 domain-containing protein n=1 Tax=Ammoniphilus sp. CFH 90114 TaxID=2493665 RepID=UPI00100DD32B|nr:DUF4855 domain-containing protein [Ammoniphilus sp. CFH 90114]RXT15378.1 DUF4855 domain-containing protein [Ammoniphilus sp. CFH 90114]
MLRKMMIGLLASCFLIGSIQAAGAESGSSPVTPSITYTVEQKAPDELFKRNEYKSYPGPIDGLLSKSDSWTGFFRQEGRDIIVDLGVGRVLSEVSLEFQQNKSAGIVLPKYMEVTVSADGHKWNKLGEVKSPVLSSDPNVLTRQYGLTFKPMYTRYVKLHFPVDVWVFARKLVLKEEPISALVEPTVLGHASKHGTPEQGYMKIEGIDDLALIYTGGHGDKGIWKKEDFLPMTAYMDRQGNIQDQLFDSFLFLPYPNLTNSKEEWIMYLEDLFKKGQQLDALNEAGKSIADKLSAKPKVVLSLPYPHPKQEQFGLLVDPTNTLIFSHTRVAPEDAAKNRASAIQWYYSELMKEWEEAAFSHLDLAGIYWYQETMDYTIPYEKELVQLAASMVHEDGHKFFWIPYFGSHGYEHWSNYGFDYVFLQPNFYAKDTPPANRMENIAEIANKHHLAVELELDDNILLNRYYYDLFYQQLNKGAEYQLHTQASNAYYLGGAKVLVQASRSNQPLARQIYDDMYQWINGTYQAKKQ